MEAMALIEIDDFPSYKRPFILGFFHGYGSHNQMVYPNGLFTASGELSVGISPKNHGISTT